VRAYFVETLIIELRCVLTERDIFLKDTTIYDLWLINSH